MKKKSVLFTCLLLVATMLLVFCACSSFGGIKSAYEDAGYEEVEMNETLKKTLESNEDYKKISEVIKLHTFQQKEGDGLLSALDVVFIAEFNSTDEMEEYLKDKVKAEDVKSVYDELQKMDVVSGNCFYLFGTNAKALEIFKGTK